MSTIAPPHSDPDDQLLDRRRYRRLMAFFTRLVANILWWEAVLRPVLGRRFVARRRAQRFQRYARQFRRLAVQMGGVMIKLGQFISTRVDVIPPEITEELAGLQDEVPPVPRDQMLAVLEAELGAPPESVFAEFDTDVQAAASLGQVYLARLKSGERVAVKVQRPGIEQLIATDLRALSVVAGWTMRWPLISRRADVPALLDEFARTLWEEVDYEAEADHAEHFAALFADDTRVYIPAVYRATSTRRVLTLEDVTSIKIIDAEAIDRAGIDREVAARRLLDIYLRMIFEFGFFHADPHPGNLFLHPLPAGPEDDTQPFQVIFVDFGMVGHITPQVKSGLREALIAVATRDTKRILSAYQMLGVLLPSADTARIEQAEAEVLDTIWGKSVADMAQMPRSEMRAFALKYRDLLYDMPFQVPQDFIYLGRAVSLLSGICTMLDPQFNPWAPVARYARRVVEEEATGSWQVWVGEAARLGQAALSLPTQLSDVLARVQRGDLRVKAEPSETLRGDLRRVESAITGLTRAMMFASLLLAGTLLYINGEPIPGVAAFALAGVSWLTLALRRRPRS